VSRRILFVDQSGVLGGGELSLLDVARAHRDGCAVVLLADGPFRQSLEGSGVTVHLLPAGAMLRLRRDSPAPTLAACVDLARVALRLARIARFYQLIYANSQKALLVAAAAGIIARRPVIWHLRDILSHRHFRPGNIRTVVTIANRRARVVIANSQATARAFTAQGGRPELVRVVYNGIDAAPFGARSADPCAVRAELGLPDGPLIGMFSRFHPWKGQHVAVEALHQMHPSVHAILVGDALFGEDGYVQAVREQVGHLGLSDRVRLLGFRQDVPRLLGAVDLVVHPSVEPEPFGRTILEAMLAGKPVVAARGGGADELIVDQVTGLFVPPGDPAELASAAAGLLADPSRRRAMGQAGAEIARRSFGVTSMLAGIDQVIGEVLGR
jgi:glycosyltransferase involved in cell wall biosynthesis